MIYEMTYCYCLYYFITHALYMLTSLGEDVNIGPLGQRGSRVFLELPCPLGCIKSRFLNNISTCGFWPLGSV